LGATDGALGRGPSGGDASRTYTPEEERRLASNLEALVTALYSGEFADAVDLLDLLSTFHRRLFDGVRSHAGRIRDADFGSETLEFGPNISEHRNLVRTQLLRILGEVERSIRSFDADPLNPEYEKTAFRVAAWAHAELIRVHPFEDGNGRTCRMMMNWILLRLGLRPIRLEALRDEYLTCLNHYHRTRDIMPLFDLTLRCYPLGP
jgi:fido (protein-threonine AMPylation protein)